MEEGPQSSHFSFFDLYEQRRDQVVIKSVTLTYLKNSRNLKAVQQLKTQPLAMTFTVPPWMVFTSSFIETNQIMRKVLVAIFYSEWLWMSCIITVWS